MAQKVEAAIRARAGVAIAVTGAEEPAAVE